jgi:hypothetical protein
VYVLLAVFAGVGAGSLASLAAHALPAPMPRAIAALVITAALVAICIAPKFNGRWLALQTGRSLFIRENYVYPVNQLSEPRRVAECAVSKIEEADALVVMEWRALYAIYYVAHVEQGRTGLVLHEARPHGTQVVTDSLLAEIDASLNSGRAVYVDSDHPRLSDYYSLTLVRGGCSGFSLFRLSPRG